MQIGAFFRFPGKPVTVGRTREMIMLRKAIAEGKKYVRLEDGSFAPFDPAQIQAMMDREVELLVRALAVEVSASEVVLDLVGAVDEGDRGGVAGGVSRRIRGVSSFRF